MNDSSKNKQTLTEKMESLKRRIRELEQAETRWKHAEEALNKSEETFRNLIENAPDAIYVHADARFLYLNPMAATLFGTASADQLIGSPLMDRFHPSCHAMIRERLHLLYEKNMALPIVEQIYIRLDGTPVPVEAHAVPITYNHQKASLTFARDISQRKRTEDALQENEEKFRTIFDRASDGILIADAITKKFLQGNATICSMLGYTKEEIESLTIHDIHPPKDISHVLDEFERLAAKEETAFAEDLPVLRKDGSIFYADIGASLAIIGGVHCLLGIFRDITERKKAEEQLRESLEQLRRAVETTIQVLVMAVEMKDPYTAGHQRQVTNLARTMATEMGLPPEKIEGLRLAGVIHDIGKITLPTEVLSKPTKLSAIELSLIREHVRSGYDILKDVESPWPLAEIVLQHHERMDGSGYPGGLKEEEILIEARILAVADVMEAMASHRPYRPALGLDAAMEEIEKNRGLLYDVHAVDACLRVFREKGYQIEGA